MVAIDSMNAQQLRAREAELRVRHQAYQSRQLALDMTRGKPSVRQLNLSNSLLEYPGSHDFLAADGSDCRNYGGLDGLPEMRRLFADLLEVEPDAVLVGGNSSLTLMHDALLRALLFGAPGGERPWLAEPQRKFLCPVPGYDRHFMITEHLGFELLPVALTGAGPDMDQVESLVAADAGIKGIWCVPKYSNPSGETYSDATVDRLAAMPTAASDFRIIWDNAYVEHHLTDIPDMLKPMSAACQAADHADRVLLFGSTSKMTFAGAGVAALAASAANLADARGHLAVQTIGPDKLNQLRHLRLFSDINALRAHMRKHRERLAPKFDIVQQTLHAELDGSGAAAWSTPRGGYFVNLDTRDGCATEVVRLAGEAGVKLTPAGAPFTHGRDPRDRNIRLAPSFPPRDDVRLAIEVLAVCVQLAVINKRFAELA